MRRDLAVVSRPATMADCEATVALQRRLGIEVRTDPARARDRWERLWEKNPALADQAAPASPGWVLEAHGTVVGFFGNVPRRYRFGDDCLVAAVASQWAVEPRFRARVGDLAAAYFGQADTDLFLATTANRAAGRVFERFGAAPLPQGDYVRALYWVLDPVGFAVAALRKRGWTGGRAAAGGRLLAAPVAAARAVPPRSPGRLRRGVEVEVVDPAGAGDELDDLWRRKLGERRRLLACRSAEDLRWHLGLAAHVGQVTVLGGRRSGRLDGYVVLLGEPAPEIGLLRGRVVDMLVVGNEGDVVDSLLAAAGERARQQGCHILEVVGLPGELRARLERFRPFSRLLPSRPFWYRAATPALQSALADEAAWYPSFYDGDSSLG